MHTSLKIVADKPSSAAKESGFSLVEILVGLAIGLIATVVMMQMFSTWEERRRTVSSGNDASITGVMAFYDLQRQIRQAGYGFNSISLFNCRLTLLNGATIPLVPVTVVPASDTSSALIPPGDPNTDRILVVSGNASSQPQGNTILYNDVASYVIQMASAFSVGDKTFATPDPCSSATLTTVTELPADTKVKTAAAPIAGAKLLVNMGGKPTVLAYAVRNGNLMACDYTSTNCGASATVGWSSIASNVVSLRAQYGRDTSSPLDGVIDSYVQTTPASACDVVKISALRIAVVARSAQYETAVNAAGKRACSVVTSVAPTWDGSTDAPINLSKQSDGSAFADWGCYRYQVFQSVIPLRNMSWISTQGC